MNYINMSKNIKYFRFTVLLIELIILTILKNDSLKKNLLNIYPLLKQINTYIKLCKKGILINRIQKSSKYIKISVIIPVFNSINSIKSTIRSIQNINMSDIEIILIDDYSLDNTVKIIQELQKEDPRIKLIKNFKNRGTLFSRSIGVLKSIGKYIMTIDQDDFFINDIFNKCYKEAEKDNIDILEFSGITINNSVTNMNKFPSIPYYLKFKENNKIIKQPILSTFIYNKLGKKYKLIDAYIWGKCIKSNIYNNALKLIGKKTYTLNVCWSEDRLVNFALFKVAFSFKFIKIYGIVHYLHSNSVGALWRKKKNYIKICHDEIINIFNIYKLTKNSKDVNIVIYELKRRFFLISYGLDKKNKLYIKTLFNKILKSKYISIKRKKKLIKLYNKYINK